MSAQLETHPLYYPVMPQSLESLGIPLGLATDIFLRRLLQEGTSDLQTLSRHLKLPMILVDQVFRNMRQQQLFEVKGMIGNDYRITLSAAGRTLATERLEISRYCGPAPVSLEAYCAGVNAQSAAVAVNRAALRQAFGDMVVSDHMLDQLGPAVISQSSIFLYGPPGNGKTSLAERLPRVFDDSVLIPYAVTVDGQIINVYDPVVHRAIPNEDEEIDQRWVLCRRPCVIVGGELAPGMLELLYDSTSGTYSSPLQMKANGGILIIDDFGRQRMSPRDLLNRWIVPLDRRVDYLALSYGLKFEIPFEVMVVFATNLAPSSLGDEAFLRRIQNKILVEPVNPEMFDEIFRRVAKAKKVALPPESLPAFRELCLGGGRSELRNCYPMDVCKILLAIARYEERPAEATVIDLQRAVSLYFASG
jgi:hypothetical protein